MSGHVVARVRQQRKNGIFYRKNGIFTGKTAFLRKIKIY
jgi:hypothetical protein